MNEDNDSRSSTPSIPSMTPPGQPQVAQHGSNDLPPPPYRSPSSNGTSLPDPLSMQSTDEMLIDHHGDRDANIEEITAKDDSRGFPGALDQGTEGVDPLLINNLDQPGDCHPDPNIPAIPLSPHPSSQAIEGQGSREDLTGVENEDPTSTMHSGNKDIATPDPPPGNTAKLIGTSPQADSPTPEVPDYSAPGDAPNARSSSPPSVATPSDHPRPKITLHLPPSPHSKTVTAKEKPSRKRPIFPVIIRRPRPSPPPRRSKRRAVVEMASRKRSKVMQSSDSMDIDDEDDDGEETELESEEDMDVDQEIETQLPRFEVHGDPEVCPVYSYIALGPYFSRSVSCQLPLIFIPRTTRSTMNMWDNTMFVNHLLLRC